MWGFEPRYGLFLLESYNPNFKQTDVISGHIFQSVKSKNIQWKYLLLKIRHIFLRDSYVCPRCIFIFDSDQTQINSVPLHAGSQRGAHCVPEARGGHPTPGEQPPETGVHCTTSATSPKKMLLEERGPFCPCLLTMFINSLV